MSEPRTLILGVGNPVRSDDGVGVHVVHRLRDQPLPPSVDAAEAGTCGLGILDLITGYDRLIIVDAIDTGRSPGTVVELMLDDLRQSSPLHVSSPHDTDLLTSIETGRRLGLELPAKIQIVAVQGSDFSTFSERCTPTVDAAIDSACQAVVKMLERKDQG